MALSIPFKLPQAVQRVLDAPALTRYFRASYPPSALEVTARRLVSVAIARAKDRVSLEAHRVVELPAGLVAPSLLRPAISDLTAFRGLVRSALEGLPGFEGRFSLVLPDRVAKVSFVELEKTAPTLQETAEIIRWKLKRSTPFRVEDGRIAFQAFPGNGTQVRCLVSLVQTQVVAQFEEAIHPLGYEAGLVDLSSFNLWNLVHDRLGLEGDSLLLNVADDHATAIIGRDGAPLFVRCKVPTAADALNPEEVKAELHPTLLYYQDRIGGPGIRTGVVRAPAEMLADLCELLRTRYQVEAVPIEVPRLDGMAGLDPERIGVLAPALGAALGR